MLSRVSEKERRAGTLLVDAAGSTAGALVGKGGRAARLAMFRVSAVPRLLVEAGTRVGVRG